MDKRSDLQYVSEYLIEDEEEKEQLPVKKAKRKAPEPKTVKLRLLKNLKLNSIGKVTGKHYHWSGGGAVVDVDILDKDKLLEKKGNPKSCCDDMVMQPYFELVE